MADVAKPTQIRENLAARLRTISVANGYRTDAGADVRTEPAQFEVTDGTRITVYPGQRVSPPDARVPTERECTVIVEVLVPVSLETPTTELEAVEADIEQSLRGFLQQPMALPLHVTDAVTLERPDGVPAMALQMLLVTRYR